jgi:UDP-GlcNAc:undecaprenyl-phosphate GlcNAc-1-phosphate transferase
MRQNLHPARIFMGDSGALFIRFMLSSLTILEHYVSPASSSLFPVLMPPLVLAVP